MGGFPWFLIKSGLSDLPARHFSGVLKTLNHVKSGYVCSELLNMFLFVNQMYMLREVS